MHDPFPLQRPEALLPYVQPVADFFSLKTLPLHFHEVMIAFSVYHVINRYISPALSRSLFPRIYPSFNARTKLNWDVHVVSFVQSTLICSLAFWVMWQDKERSEMNNQERVHGYTGASGLIQAFAGGYFLWDLVITMQNVRIFGIGMLFHAISALCVFSLGFRPFVNYYASTFILYELSSPFLNIHWFCDKLNMTGTTLQLVNGIVLLFTFFSCRIVWGTYQSVRVFGDVYRAYNGGSVAISDPEFGKLNNGTVIGNAGFKHDVLQFAEGQTVPLWLAGVYLASNLTLNGLNWFWFGKMIETLRTRFDPPIGTRRPETKKALLMPEIEPVLVEGTHVVTPAAIEKDAEDYIDAGADVKLEKSRSGTHLEINQSEVRSRTSTRRRG
ncbi:Nn.00g047760.m01.CDS01 [Neocucurbitaria sp. VM-36]